MSIRWTAWAVLLITLSAGTPRGWAQAASPANPGSPPRIQYQGGVTTVTALNQATTQPLSRIVDFRTSDALGVYSSRPVVAVGDITNIDLTSRTITVKIDRTLSDMPHVLKARAKKAKVDESRLVDRLFPPERTFIIKRNTTLLDGTRSTTATMGAQTQRERFDSLRLKLEDFKPGDRVSVRFIYYENDAKPPGVLNVSKQPRERRDYQADYRIVPILQRTTTGTQELQTSPTTALPPGVFVPPRLPRGQLQPPANKRD